MKRTICFIAATMALVTFAAPAPGASAKSAPKGHVTTKGVRPILPQSKDRNHILVVNVGDAIPNDIFPEVVTYAVSRLQINVWTNSIGKSVVRQLLDDPSLISKTFGPHARVVVFMERNAGGPRCLQSPGAWSMVNVAGMENGAPDPQTVKDRYAKLVMKGLGYASGAGVSLDKRCSLYFDADTPEKLDQIGITIAPMGYFPMLENLMKVGGNEIVAPVLEE